MKKIVKLTESDLSRIVKQVIKENENEEYLEKIKMLVDAEHFEPALQLGQTLDLENEVFDLIVDKIINRDFWIFSDTFYRLVRMGDNPKFASTLNAFIKGKPDFKKVLDQIDPNSRQEKYNEIYSKMREKFTSDRKINRD